VTFSVSSWSVGSAVNFKDLMLFTYVLLQSYRSIASLQVLFHSKLKLLELIWKCILCINGSIGWTIYRMLS
jgi:hypothetical protein